MSDLLPLLAGVVIMAAMVAAILVPLLRRKRLVLHLELVDGRGTLLPGVPIYGSHNRAGPALAPSGQGYVGRGSQLVASEDLLGTSDAHGRFLLVSHLRQYHTLRIGEDRVIFVDTLRAAMSETQAARIDVSRDPYDFTGGHLPKPTGHKRAR